MNAKRFPLVCAIVICVANLIWDATRYHNSLVQADYERSIGIGALVFAAVRRGVQLTDE